MMIVFHYWLKDSNEEIKFVTTDSYMGDIDENTIYNDEQYVISDWVEENLYLIEPEDY